MSRRSKVCLAIILAFSVLLRVGVALYLGDVVDAPPLLTDQRSYHSLAVRLLGGHGYSFERAWYPFTPADAPTAHWSFLYPLFVAAVYGVFGAHPLAARLVQAVLGGVLLPWMVYRLARRVFSPSPPSPGLPLIAAAIAAVYLYFVLYAATLMTETFYIVALLWSLEVGLRVGNRLRAGERVPAGLTLQLGLSLGLAALLRQSILPWVPVLFVWLLWQTRATTVGTLERSNVQTLKRSNVPSIFPLFLAGLVLLACILPWTVRNYVVYDEFLLLNSNTGYAMYSAQHPMHGTGFREFDAAPLPEDVRGLNEAQMDRELMRRAVRFVLDDPVRYLLLSLSRVRAYFEFWPTFDTTLLHNVGRVGSFGLFLPFMLYGLYLAIRRLRSAPADAHFASCILLLAIFGIFYSLLHILTWAMVRYRLPVDAVLIPFAALAIRDIYARGRRRLAAHRPTE
jgi:hypothetical protein